MKKLICLCLASLSIVVCFSACSNKQDTNTIDDNVKVISFDTTRQQETTKKFRKNKNYKITISGEDIAAEFDGSAEDYAAFYGYEIVENEDGNVTYKMDGKQYGFLLSRVGSTTIRNIGDLVDSEDFPFVKKIGDYSEDFSYILILVNGKKYNKSDKKDIFPALISQCGLFYQRHYAPESPSCRVVIADEKSGKVLFNECYTQ